MARRGIGAREISQVAVKNHANAARNPYAQFREPVTLAAVTASRLVADPLRLFHCCPISDGAAALVLTAGPAAVRIAGMPLHIAIVELRGGAHLVCYGDAARGIRIGSRVSKAVNHVYYFAHLEALARARLFRQRAGRRGERLEAIARSWAKRIWRGWGRDTGE